MKIYLTLATTFMLFSHAYAAESDLGSTARHRMPQRIALQEVQKGIDRVDLASVSFSDRALIFGVSSIMSSVNARLAHLADLEEISDFIDGLAAKNLLERKLGSERFSWKYSCQIDLNNHSAFGVSAKDPGLRKQVKLQAAALKSVCDTINNPTS